MKIFSFDPDDHREAFSERGWVHIEGGIHPEFLAFLREYAQTSLEESRLDAFAIKGKKEQSIFEFPKDADYPTELYDVVSQVCGLDRSTITLSERHIQAYEPNADPEPAAHKDRFGSQISVGFSIDIPEGSTLVLYPQDCPEVNPFNSSKTYYQSLSQAQQPGNALKDATAVEIADRPGDVIMFRGSSTWHLRRNAANAVNLYVKLNDFGCDPLREDPATPVAQERTRERLEATNGEYSTLIPVIARTFDRISRDYTRDGWREVVWATIFGEEPFAISEEQFTLIRAVDGIRNWEAVLAEADNGSSSGRLEADLVELGERGVIDLQEPRA
jgi:hypothetical protein